MDRERVTRESGLGLTRRELLQRGVPMAGAIWALPVVKVIDLHPTAHQLSAITGAKTESSSISGDEGSSSSDSSELEATGAGRVSAQAKAV